MDSLKRKNDPISEITKSNVDVSVVFVQYNPDIKKTLLSLYALISQKDVTYIFPLSRLIDFLIGCCFGLLIVLEKRRSIKGASFLGIISMGSSLCLNVLCVLNVPFLNLESIR